MVHFFGTDASIWASTEKEPPCTEVTTVIGEFVMHEDAIRRVCSPGQPLPLTVMSSPGWTLPGETLIVDELFALATETTRTRAAAGNKMKAIVRSQRFTMQPDSFDDSNVISVSLDNLHRYTSPVGA